jgi:hypothetical protein
MARRLATVLMSHGLNSIAERERMSEMADSVGN